MQHNSGFWANKRILITGVTGFVGSWLAEKLVQGTNAEIYGLKRQNSGIKKLTHIGERITFVDGDILDTDSLANAVNSVSPDVIFHLAAQGIAKKGFKEPFSTFSLNFQGTMNLLEAIRKSNADIKKIQFSSSANVYGEVAPQNIPIKENQELNPVEMYGVSKAAADYLCRSYAKIYGMPIVVNRGFHHEGLRCHEDMVGMEIARQVASVVKGDTKTLTFGNIDVVRDLNDVRDITDGYIATVEKGKNGEVYNICSSKGYKIRDLINTMLSRFNIKDIRIEVDPARLRSKDMPVLIGDNSKAKTELVWEPKIDFQDTLVELINYYISKS